LSLKIAIKIRRLPAMTKVIVYGKTTTAGGLNGG
jgi:hypothetical protein